MPPQLREDWTFELTGLKGRRTISAGIFQGEWVTKSLSVEGTDVTDTGIDFRNTDVDGIDLVLTQQKTDLSGRVTDTRGATVTNATVIAFADDPDQWSMPAQKVRSAQLDQDGKYRIQGLRPGEYLVIAVDEIEPGEESDPELLEQYRHHASRVTVGEGETRAADLTLTTY
jgi:protocatechuate 3,4-dioxygenase beta subunit